MHIKIAERLKPYSHLPGTYFVLPGSDCRLQIFPSLLKVDDLSGAVPASLATISLDIKGPVKEYTAELDLEKGQLRVWGHSSDGYFRYRLTALTGGKGIAIVFEKAPEKGINCSSQGNWKLTGSEVIHAGSSLILSAQTSFDEQPSLFHVPKIDRLSLGNHKSQDWELVQRRRNFAEIFPIWHRLGQLVPYSGDIKKVGTLTLLEVCRQALSSNAPETILAHFERLFLAGFEGILSPRLCDTDFQGLNIPCFSADSRASPLQLLSHGAALIRSMFVQQNSNTIHLMPALPTEFHCGRLVDVACEGAGSLDIEWTKKAIRCVTFAASRTQALAFTFANGEKRCRLRHSHNDRGTSYVPGQSLDVLARQNYWFDNFER